VSAIHGACDVTVHAHSRATTTEIVPVPPDGLKDDGAPVTVGWQRAVVVGLVTLVEVELPQAAAVRSPASAMTYG